MHAIVNVAACGPFQKWRTQFCRIIWNLCVKHINTLEWLVFRGTIMFKTIKGPKKHVYLSNLAI